MSRLALVLAYLISLASPAFSAGPIVRPVTVQTGSGLRLSVTSGVLYNKKRLPKSLETGARVRPFAAARSLAQMTQAQPGRTAAGITAMAFDGSGSGHDGTAVAAAPAASETEIIVEAPIGGNFAPVAVTEDLAVGFGGADVDDRLRAQSEAFGLPVDGRGFIGGFAARPVGSITLLNAMVYHVDSSVQARMIADLNARGYRAKAGKVYRMPEPTQPAAPRAVGLKEAAKIIGSDRLQAEIEKAIGAPKPSDEPAAPTFFERAKRFLRRVFLGVAVSNPVIPWALVDTYMQSSAHPYLKGRFVKEIGGTPDGQIHGFHVAGITVGMDRHNFHGYAFNIFPKGSATEGDILMKLNMAVAEHGVAITGNSWGDSEGMLSDRFMKDGQKGDLIMTLMEKQALEKGVHHSISAGNQGSGANTIGGPAIGTAQVEVKLNGKLLGVIDRIQAIAAGDADKLIAGFSSRGKWSPWVAGNNKDGRYNDYPRRPLRTAIGVNVVAPVPKGQDVPELGGPGRALSGTSMSRPQDQGAKMQLARAIMVLLGDYLPKLADPKAQLTQVLDLAEWAMQKAAVKHRDDADFEVKYGNGFDDVWAAFELSAAALKSTAAPSAARWARELTRKAMGLGGFGDELAAQATFDEKGLRFAKP